MDTAAVLALIEKGIAIIPILIQFGQDIAPAIEILKNVVTGAQAGTITDEELAQNEAELDALIADFNTDLPPTS